MELRPLKQYQEPKLPTRQIIDQHPELLRLVPRRWQTNPIVLSALAGVCTLVLANRTLADKQVASASRVAPLFHHGEGRASFGGDMALSHSFLSEEEARKVIEDEALKAGISFAQDTHRVDGLNVRRPDPSGFHKEREGAQLKKKESFVPQASVTEKFGLDEHYGSLHKEGGPLKELVFDGSNVKRRIHYEYVSAHDFGQWQSNRSASISTVSYYNIRSTADALRTGLAERKPEGVYVVFYDPLVNARTIPEVSWPEELARATSVQRYETKEKMIWEASRAELRKQVQDFIKWLKTQGVI